MKKSTILLFLIAGIVRAQAAGPIPLPPLGRILPISTNIFIGWETCTSNNDSSLLQDGIGYRLYVSRKSTPASTTWSAFSLTNTYPMSATNTGVFSVPRGCYTFYVTCLNSITNESDPSNFMYFQLYTTWPQAVAATLSGR